KNIKTQIETILENGKIIDSKGRSINFRNTVFIFIDTISDVNIGFIEIQKSNANKISDYIDEVIVDVPKNLYYNKMIDNIIKRLRDYHYYIDINCSDMGLTTYKKLLSKLSDLDNFEKEK